MKEKNVLTFKYEEFISLIFSYIYNLYNCIKQKIYLFFK